MNQLDPWYLQNIVCPVDGKPLYQADDRLISDAGRSYPIHDGIPVMLRPDVDQTLEVATASLELAGRATADRYCIRSLGIDDAERAAVADAVARNRDGVDPVVASLLVATGGHAYKGVRASRYPIPHVRLPEGKGQKLLDVGCNWGRWSIAAAQKGYDVVGIDPSLGAVLAARRVARQLGLLNRYVVGDARHLPFRRDMFDVVFSYSVLQHFAKHDVILALGAIRSVLRPGGHSLIQMANAIGIRSFMHLARRRFGPGEVFDVRYWTVPELENAFDDAIGESKTTVDCYLGLGLQKADWEILPPVARVAIAISETLRQMSRAFRPLRYIADSIYVESRKASA